MLPAEGKDEELPPRPPFERVEEAVALVCANALLASAKEIPSAPSAPAVFFRIELRQTECITLYPA